jgi:Zn finger protein HypA/HybF involved in hydrogenase expression
MQSQPPKIDIREQANTQRDDERTVAHDSHEMPCPVCGTPMPDLKGGKATICSVCGFKDSCCY